jgi:hypothetical protein
MRRPLLLLLTLLATLGLLAACGTSGGQDAPTASEDQTEPDGGGATATREQLEALLPTAEEVGSEYELDESSADGDDDDGDDEDEDDEIDRQFEEACPGIADLDFLDSGSGADDDAASATFTTEDDREVEVNLDPLLDELNEDNVDALVDALADCTDIEVTDEDGFTLAIDIRAERDDTFGDFGLRMDFEATVTAMGFEIPLTFAGQAFSVDGIGVTISATSGIIEDDEAMELTPVPFDEDVLASVSELMAERVGSL